MTEAGRGFPHGFSSLTSREMQNVALHLLVRYRATVLEDEFRPITIEHRLDCQIENLLGKALDIGLWARGDRP
jgi:hypothetical protein